MTQYRTESDFTETVIQQRADSSSSSSTTTTTTMNNGAGRVLFPQDYEAIRTGYVDVLGQLNGFKARDIEWAINNGLEASAILDALEVTAMAKRPTHYYFRAILHRYATFGIHTAEDAERDREAWAARREAANRESWGAWYKDPAEDMPW